MALILNESDYESVAEKIRDLGTVCISLSGRVHLLPAAMVTHRESETPSYYISVESIDIEKSLTTQPMVAAAYITFSVDESLYRAKTHRPRGDLVFRCIL
jgi:hypothetical protein